MNLQICTFFVFLFSDFVIWLSVLAPDKIIRLKNEETNLLEFENPACHYVVTSFQ